MTSVSKILAIVKEASCRSGSARQSTLPDVLLSTQSAIRDYFAREAIKRMISEHVAGTKDHHHRLWQVVVLEEWHPAFVDVRLGRTSKRLATGA